MLASLKQLYLLLTREQRCKPLRLQVLMVLIIFGAVIFLAPYLFAAHQGDLGTIMMVLSVYALTGFKLLPAFQQIYTSIAQVHGNLDAFDRLEEDLKANQYATTGTSAELADHLVRQHKAAWITHLPLPGKQETALNDMSA